MNSTTVAALSSAYGRGAIAVIRITGPKSKKILKSVFFGSLESQAGKMKAGWIVKNGEKIDQVMAVYYTSPNSFTGEDMVEIFCHGSPVIIEEILNLIYLKGAKPAQPGEFSKRAFLNGKIDLAQAEAIMELVSAQNSRLARLASHQLAGSFSKQINQISDNLAQLSAKIIADLDFLEEDIPEISNQTINSELNLIQQKISELLMHSDQLKILREGINIIIIGLANAGKSTLLNKLLGFERSIVTEIAGTTRDTITETIEINGVNCHFTDTAGLNPNPGKVEKIGIKRTKQAIHQADIMLVLIEPGKTNQTLEYLKKIKINPQKNQEKLIIVHTKSDTNKPIQKTNYKYEITISAKKEVNINKIKRLISTLIHLTPEANIHILTQRQIEILQQSKIELDKIIKQLNQTPKDIITSEIQSLIDKLNQLTGKDSTKQIIDSVFANFCIGK